MVTDPLQTVLWTMERAYGVHEQSYFRGHEEEKAYLEHVFIRNELLWKQFDTRFESCAREVCKMSSKEAMDSFEHFDLYPSLRSLLRSVWAVIR